MRDTFNQWLGVLVEVDSFGIWVLPTMLTWLQHKWSFQSKSSVQPTFKESWWLAFVKSRLQIIISPGWLFVGIGQFWRWHLPVPPAQLLGSESALLTNHSQHPKHFWPQNTLIARQIDQKVYCPDVFSKHKWLAVNPQWYSFVITSPNSFYRTGLKYTVGSKNQPGVFPS